jgi:spermidine/putrescine transport system substrate-binding protein
MNSWMSGRAKHALAWVMTAQLGFALASGATLAAEPLHYFTWGGYDVPEFRPDFTAKYGKTGVVYSFFADTNEAFAKLKAGYKADIVHPGNPDVQKWIKAGLLQPIDTSKVAAWNDLVPAIRDTPTLMAGGQHYVVPWEWGFSSILYRTDKLKDPAQDYRLLIDPKFAGRTAIPDAFDEIYLLAAILAGVKDPYNLQPGDYAKVETVWHEMRHNARFVWSDPSQLEQAMAAGEIDLAWGWPNSYRNLLKQKIPVAFMLKPKQKLVTWIDGFAITKDATAPTQEIYDFINALETPETGKLLVDEFGYGASNRKGLAMVPKQDLATLGLDGDPEQTVAGGNLLKPMPEKQRKRLTEMWSLIKAGG